jgi:hypothetical protein
MSDISVSKVVKTITDDKDSYDVLLKGQMRLNHQTDGSFDEIADIELKVKGVDQRQLLEDNGLFRIGSVKVLDLRDVQTSLSDFEAPGNTWIREHILEQELWFDATGMGEVRTRNEVRAIYLDLEEQELITITFLQFLDAMVSVDDLYEDNPEMIRAIRLHKHGYDFWGPRMQIYGCEADE